MTLHTRLARLERAHATEPEGVTPDFSQVGAPALKAMGEALKPSIWFADSLSTQYSRGVTKMAETYGNYAIARQLIGQVHRA